MTLYSVSGCVINCGAMNTPSLNLGRYSRLALLLLMLASQGIAVAHDIGDNHGLKSHPCSSCIIGHGLGAAISASFDTPALPFYRAFAPAHPITANLCSRVNCHKARAPPVSPSKA